MQNRAINPKDAAYTIRVTPLRSDRIKQVNVMKGGGGASAADTSGKMWVPDSEDAAGRIIRMHEALHLDFTPRRGNKPADMLDQALEDARLHRHCSGTRKLASEGIDGPRRDELTVALKDLRKVLRDPNPARAIDSLITLRAMGICGAEYPELVSKACARISKKFQARAESVIESLKESKGEHESEQWKAAREVMAPYFREDFEGKPKPEQSSKDDESKPEDKKPQKQESKPESEPEEAEPEEAEPEEAEPEEAEPEEAEPEDDEDESKNEGEDAEDSKDSEDSEDGEGEDEGEDDSEGSIDGEDGEDSSGKDSKDGEDGPESDDTSEDGEDSEGESEDSVDGEKGLDGAMAPAIKVKTFKPAPIHEDEYTAELAPEFDGETYGRMQSSYPMKIYIRRLDETANSVRTTEGLRKPMMLSSGARIVAKRLAAGMTTPGVRVFAKNNCKGGGGSILIDASGSMRLTDNMLTGFLQTAPMITLGFYNAQHDSYKVRNFGNIYIYAANGRRAKTLAMDRIRRGVIGDRPREAKAAYGHANLIDYQAIAWLLKQPAPRYLISDSEFTGPWSDAAHRLLRESIKRGLIKQVYSIPHMQSILNHREHDWTGDFTGRYFKESAERAAEEYKGVL